MTNTYDYLDFVQLRAIFRDDANAITPQSSVTITITNSGGIVIVSAAAMTLLATGAYKYDYAIPAAGPEGKWSYTAIGVDASGNKRVSSGVFIVKSVDIPYTTPTTVRELLPDLLWMDLNVGVITGSTITLTSSAVEVPTILKNNTQLYESEDFSFTQPKTITLLLAGAGENFTPRLHLTYTETQVRKFITRSDRIINAVFTGKTLPTDGLRGDWSASLTVSQILKSKAKGDEDQLAWAKSYEDDAMQSMDKYIANMLRITCSDAKVTRADSTNANAFKLDQSNLKKYV